MYPIIDDPEIGHIQRTGYPSWMEDQAEAFDEDRAYEERRERELFGE